MLQIFRQFYTVVCDLSNFKISNRQFGKWWPFLNFYGYCRKICILRVLELFNATLWNRIPKNKFHGQKRIETALMLCIIEYEDGKAGLLPVMSSLGIFSSEAGRKCIWTARHKNKEVKGTGSGEKKDIFLVAKKIKPQRGFQVSDIFLGF